MKLHKDLTGEDLHAPKGHRGSHSAGGSDELDLTGLGAMVLDGPDAKYVDIDYLFYSLETIIASLETKIDILADNAGVDFPGDS